MERKRISGADFVRAVSAMGIVTHHFSSTIAASGKGNVLPLNGYANGSWGPLFVAVFFILSGAMLYYNYPEIKNLKSFYFKRWKSIYPMFYIAYAIFCIESVAINGSFFYKGSPVSFIATVLGMDGYFSYRMPVHYYLLGEWFLGAIILLYVIYPLLVQMMKKPIISTIAITVAYVWQLHTTIFQISPARNLIACAFSFWLGMLFMRYYSAIEKLKWVWTAVALIGTIVFIYVPIPINVNYSIRIMGACVFVLLLFVGNFIYDKRFKITVAISQISKLSYSIFLVHHVLLYKIINPFKGLNLEKTVILLIATYAICIMVAYGVYYLNTIIVGISTKFYNKVFKQ